MGKVQENLLIRLAAWVLFFGAVWGCAMFGQQTILSLLCANYAAPEDSGYFSRILEWSRREALDAPAVWRKKRRNGQKGESCPAC